MNPPSILSGPVAYLDLETTGLDPRRNRIIEIGIVYVKDGEVTKHQWFVDPGTELPPEIVRFTGITPADIEGAPHFSTIADELYELLEGATIVAHNARFDVGFLTESFAREGFSFRPKQLCTVALSRALIPNLTRANLDAVLSALSIPSVDRHRALPDAEAVFDVCKALSPLSTFPETVERLINGRLSCPPGLTETDIATLPTRPGVYVFLNKENTVLYVGKANNIRSRVRSHFTGVLTGTDATVWKEIASVTFEETDGEISALLKESQLVKALMPLHNKQLRRNSHMYAILFKDGVVYIEKVPNILLSDVSSIVGVFRSVVQAKERLWELSKEHMLCPKYLGLTHEKGACFHSQIGFCNGVCAGEEDQEVYNARVIEALKSIRVPAWPYPDQVVILSEKNASEEPVNHLIFNWCYMGFVQSERSELVPLSFDWDMYKILRKALLFPKKWRVKLKTVPLETFQAGSSF